MTTKNVGKKRAPAVGAANPVRPPQEDVQAAYQIHTLAQMLYGQMATVHPWATGAHPAAGVDPMTMHGMAQQPGVNPFQPVETFGPAQGVEAAHHLGHGQPFDPAHRFGPFHGVDPWQGYDPIRGVHSARPFGAWHPMWNMPFGWGQ